MVDESPRHHTHVEINAPATQRAFEESIGAAEYARAWETLRKMALRYPPGSTVRAILAEVQRTLEGELQVEHGQRVWSDFVATRARQAKP